MASSPSPRHEDSFTGDIVFAHGESCLCWGQLALHQAVHREQGTEAPWDNVCTVPIEESISLAPPKLPERGRGQTRESQGLDDTGRREPQQMVDHALHLTHPFWPGALHLRPQGAPRSLRPRRAWLLPILQRKIGC